MDHFMARQEEGGKNAEQDAYKGCIAEVLDGTKANKMFHPQDQG